MRRTACAVLAAGICVGVGACAPAGPVTVLRATYGESCGQPAGNVSWTVERACRGRAACELQVVPATLGDPAEGCGKDFEVLWACPVGDPAVRRAYVPAETSNGATVRLACD